MRTVIGFFLFVAAAAAQVGQPKARIEGRLENALTGEPLRQGVLHLRIATATFRGPQYVAESDPSGNFVFDQVDPGFYVLSADQPGFLRSNYGAHFLANGEPIRLRAGEKQLLRVSLMPRSAVSGRVLDSEGEPPQNIEVAAWRWRWSASAGQRLLELAGQVVADKDGNFHLTTLRAGEYLVSASSLNGYRPNGPGVLRRRTANDKAPEGYQTTFYPGVLSVGDAKGINVAAGEEIDGLNLQLKRTKLFKIRGTVADSYSFRPLNVMMVELTPLDRPAEAFPGAARSVQVEDGAFEFDGVPPGRYSVSARDNSPAEHLVARTDVLLGEKDVENVRVQLRAGAEVKCVVWVERLHNEVHDLPEGAGQNSSVKATVMLRSADGGSSNAIAATQDLPGGPFRLRDIPPGSYWVDVTNLPAGFYVKRVRFGDLDITSTPLKLGPGGSEPPLEVMLSDRTATLSGIVVGSGGGSARIAQVMLAPASKDLERVSRLVKGTISGVDGRFRFDGIAPGQYVLFAFEDAEPGLVEDPEYRARFLASAAEVNLGPSTNQSIEIHSIR